jgi:prepilin-type N-terminal cleavage/methylation domain-containing protein
MKTPSKPFSRKGFTLVELLVVIAIIAVLASAGFAVGPAMMNRAKKLSAQAGATSLATAVEQFYTEYSALPDVGTGAPLPTNLGGDGVELLNILVGQEDGNEPQNPRKIRFFSAKEAKGTGTNARDGLLYSSDDKTISAFVDPWGEPYYIVMDNESDTEGYDELLQFTPKDNSPVTVRGRSVAVFSLGVDKNSKSNAKTLVKTW